MVCDYFIPLYFLTRFPMYKVEFSIIYGLASMCLGIPSVMAGGILADKLGTKWYTRICQASSFLPWPLSMIALTHSNFFVAMGAMSVSYLVCNLWMSPNISLMQKTINSEEFGGAMSAYQFVITMAGCLGAFLVGSVVPGMLPSQVGKVIAGALTIMHICSILSWQKAK